MASITAALLAAGLLSAKFPRAGEALSTSFFERKDGLTNRAARLIAEIEAAGYQVAIDQVPDILLVTPPAPATYLDTQTLTFTVKFSAPVAVTGTPRIPITVGATQRYATYASGTGTDTLTFTYLIVTADADADGIAVTSPLELNSGTIKKVADNATLTFTVPVTTGVILT